MGHTESIYLHAGEERIPREEMRCRRATKAGGEGG